MNKLETLQRIASFCLFAKDFENRVDEFGALGVETLVKIRMLYNLMLSKNARQTFAQLLPAPEFPFTKVSGRNNWPILPLRI